MALDVISQVEKKTYGMGSTPLPILSIEASDIQMLVGRGPHYMIKRQIFGQNQIL